MEEVVQEESESSSESEETEQTKLKQNTSRYGRSIPV